MESIEEIAKLNATEYKKYHESYMQNNHGSSALHVFFCILFTVQCTIIVSIKEKTITTSQYTLEYLVIVLPLILAHTILSEYIYLLNLILSIVLVYITIKNCPKHTKLKKRFTLHNIFRTRKLKSISCMRGLTYLITVLCILAVDFMDFPRHLAKTEQYGYSLMDTGVGLFVLMSGLVHKYVNNNNYLMVAKGNARFVFILTFLGIARCVSVKQLDYHEHVTEYGVHWNFFFTLAACKLFSTIILYISHNALVYSFVILFIHECLLFFGLQDWVFGDSTRNSFLSANREGISSNLGYISLYLFGAYIKKQLNDSTYYRYILQVKLLVGSAILWILSYLTNYYLPASRTLANAAYCIYLETVLISVVAILYFFEIIFLDKKNDKFTFDVPLILSYMNTNGLSYFLGANLLTGAINMSMRTLLISRSVTFLILNIYMILTIGFVKYLREKGVTI